MNERFTQIGIEGAEAWLDEMARTSGECQNCGDYSAVLFDDECKVCHIGEMDYAIKHGTMEDALLDNMEVPSLADCRAAVNAFRNRAIEIMGLMNTNPTTTEPDFCARCLKLETECKCYAQAENN